MSTLSSWTSAYLQTSKPPLCISPNNICYEQHSRPYSRIFHNCCSNILSYSLRIFILLYRGNIGINALRNKQLWHNFMKIEIFMVQIWQLWNEFFNFCDWLCQKKLYQFNKCNGVLATKSSFLGAECPYPNPSEDLLILNLHYCYQWYQSRHVSRKKVYSMDETLSLVLLWQYLARIVKQITSAEIQYVFCNNLIVSLML